MVKEQPRQVIDPIRWDLGLPAHHLYPVLYIFLPPQVFPICGLDRKPGQVDVFGPLDPGVPLAIHGALSPQGWAAGSGVWVFIWRLLMMAKLRLVSPQRVLRELPRMATSLAYRRLLM